LIVQDTVQAEFLRLLSQKLGKIRTGDPLDEATQVGALFDAGHQQKVLGYIERGIKAGGKVLCGGQAMESKGYFIEPTLISGASMQAEISREEIFGPVLTTYTFKTYEEAIQLANDSQYGLSASIWSSGLDNAMRAVRDIEAGRVWVNTTLENGPEMPLGGMKSSGMGRESGMMGIEEYTEVKSVNIRLAKKPLWLD
jgi:acyl-CoA reductase-like NAD-dependent aldehyde dehydrogenase